MDKTHHYKHIAAEQHAKLGHRHPKRLALLE